MKIHVFQHVPFEGPAFIETLANARGHALRVTRLDLFEPPPGPEEYDMLVVMGGPMGANDEGAHSWLAAEKRAVHAALAGGRKVLGICLGAQIIAAVMGAAVYRNRYREIGWYPVTLDAAVAETPLWRDMPPVFDALHWHGDTFDIPAGARRIGGSRACPNQGFVAGDRVAALQFHLEATPRSVELLLENAADEIDGSEFVAGPDDIRGNDGLYASSNALLARIFDAYEALP